MFDMQRTMDALGRVMQHSRAGYHLTLGGLIEALERVPNDRAVVVDRGGTVDGLESYRGYYDDLALLPSEAAVTAGDLLADCRQALGATFTGYKGGEFVMGPTTPLWLSAYGSASGVALVGVVVTDEQVILTTKDVD